MDIQIWNTHKKGENNSPLAEWKEAKYIPRIGEQIKITPWLYTVIHVYWVTQNEIQITVELQ